MTNVNNQFMPETVVGECLHDFNLYLKTSQDQRNIHIISTFSPLVKSSDGTLIGITSFGRRNFFKKYDPATPQAFTNVYSYLEWIGEVTGMKLPKC